MPGEYHLPKAFHISVIIAILLAPAVFADRVTSVSILGWAEDPDQDGISTEQEIIDGTDPEDPASALAWHPNDLPDFPRLIADRARWDEAWTKVQNGEEPYYSFYLQAIGPADGEPAMPQAYDYDTQVCLNNARIARAAAVRFWGAGDPADAAKASEILRNTDTQFEVWTYETLDYGGILVSQALILLCQAYEILRVTGGFGPGEEEESGRVIRALTTSYHHYYTDYFPLWLMATRNNHNVKFDSAVGYAALTFNNWDRAAEFINFGLTEAAYWQLEMQNCPGAGCCAEGPNYLAYSSINYLPFFLAYHRFAEGDAYPYKTSCANHLWPFCREEIQELVDPVDDPRFAEMHDWWLHLRMPDGYGMLLDDSNRHCFNMGILAALTGDGRYRWVYDNGPQCRQYAGDLAWEQLLLLPDLPEAVTPSDADLFWVNEPAGQAVFRSGWDDQARFLLLNAEHGQARRQGMGHEQPDSTSFVIAAYGELFMIDSGYIEFSQRELVAGPENHNLILVDGEGPPRGFRGAFCDVPAYLTEWANEGLVFWAVAEAHWADADMRRLAALVDQSYLMVVDWPQSDYRRNYQWLGHTNSGGSTDGTFQLNDDGATITRPTAAMQVAISTTPTKSDIFEETKDHGFIHGQVDEHAVINIVVKDEAPVFLSSFVPTAGGQPQPEVRIIKDLKNQVAQIIITEDYLDLWAASRLGRMLELPGGVTGLPEVRSDAELILVRFDPQTLDVVETWQKGGTYLWIDE